MFGPESATCFPFLNPASNCCLGGQRDAACASSSDCRGLMTCSAGICRGESGCDEACTVQLDGRSYDCCTPEPFNFGTCASDSDCQGARYCTEDGYCAGYSGCQAQSSGQYVTYDKECLCLGIGGFCSYSAGIPCADGCAVWSPAPGLLVCSRLDLFGSTELTSVSP